MGAFKHSAVKPSKSAHNHVAMLQGWWIKFLYQGITLQTL